MKIILIENSAEKQCWFHVIRRSLTLYADQTCFPHQAYRVENKSAKNILNPVYYWSEYLKIQF